MANTPCNFDNTWTRLPERFYSRVPVTPLQNPQIVSVNPAVAAMLDLSPEQVQAPEMLAALNGETGLAGADPIASVYAGHQFGIYVSRLGDGRAILLGELRTESGDKFDLQIKGSGPTPYSRGFDGRAVLRSCIREYLAGEAMHALGVPSTRALCLYTSDTPVQREQVERGSALVRVAKTHLRFGSFEYFHHSGDPQGVRELADYAIEHVFPELQNEPEEQRYRALLMEITARTARLIAHWQSVGFTHGVMNTDNMSVIGDTIDYGPYGFMEYYQGGYCPNHSDHDGRYAFTEQVEIGRWNCLALTEALSTLVPGKGVPMAVMGHYRDEFRAHYLRLMRGKLGLSSELDEDDELIVSLLAIMEKFGFDYHRFFRLLSACSGDGDNQQFLSLYPQESGLSVWLRTWQQRLALEPASDQQRREQMEKVNPKYVLRNYLAQQVIEAAEAGDYAPLQQFLALLQAPFDEHPDYEAFARPVDPEVEQVAISCSS